MKDFSSNSTRIGWVGTGVMGLSMCGHLLEKGYPVTVYTRTQSKAMPLVEKGARWADSPKSVAEDSDIIFTMVGYPKDVEEVYFGKNGIFSGVKPNKVLVDMTTTRPSLAEKIYSTAKTKNVFSVDAPVSGGDVGAKNGTLSIMVGGDKEIVDAIMPLFQLMGKNIVYQGKAGAGQHTKMCNQIQIAGTMIGMCECLLYSQKAGLNAETMLQSIQSGAAGCWSLNNLAPRILKRNLDPGFFVEHFIKDMEIALDEAKRMNLALPGLTLVHQLYLTLQSQGHGKKGTHALILALEQLSKTEIK